MNNQKVVALNELLNSVDQKDFNLDVWKIKASLVVKKIFGSSDEKLELIEALHYDYSSWSLRDKTGSKQPDTVKAQAKGILESAILELAIGDSVHPVLIELQQELTGSEMSRLQQLLDDEGLDETRLMDYLSGISPQIKDKVLTQLLLKKYE
ncbi:MAG: hypothetical protein ACERKD_17630 [Prolixibacteraceae bacterium]